MPKSRDRQLAKQYARRRAERRARERKRSAAIAVGAGLGVAAIAIVVLALLLGGGDETKPSASGGTGTSGTSGATGTSGTSGPSGATGSTGSTKPGKQTGTVDPTAGPTEVACGGTVPPGAMDPKPQFAAPKQVLEKGKTYTAMLQTSCGDIVIELLADQAPETVNSFVFLAQRGFFDGQRIHRIDTSIDVLQGGDPTGTGSGGPGYSIPDELTGKDTYGPGTFAMANAGPNTGGSQFFIITGENGHKLDANPAYTVFGKVISGLDVAKTIQQLPIQDPNAGIAGQQPAQAVYIEKVTISAT